MQGRTLHTAEKDTMAAAKLLLQLSFLTCLCRQVNLDTNKL